ncbi:MAG: nucleotidyltransferase domain-containing protein [Bacteroidota bacterium]|nr:nucleotidyltransferase domain-containing protein [Bacteroidota bacterium]
MNEVSTRLENKQQLFELLYANLDAIKNYGISLFGVFDSFVRNEMNEDSDVDFLVEFYPEKKTFKNFIRLTFFLEDLCGREAEVVTVAGLSKYIGPKILASAEYIFRN